MSDPTSTSTLAPTPAPAPKRTRGTVNRAHLDELTNSRKVAASAINPAYTDALAGVDFDATLAAKITTLAGKIDTDIGKLTGARAAKKTMTAQETTARLALIGVIAPIQTAAKRKFTGDTATLREAYYIGESLTSDTLDEVLAAARGILGRLTPGDNNAPPQDVLPGVKADQIKALSDAITVYDTRNTAQGGEDGNAAKTLEAIAANIGTLAGLRHQVQLAADQAWPWRTPGVAAIRKDFLLPPDRPMVE